MSDGRLKVLLIDDDRDDYLIVRVLLSRIQSGSRHNLAWVSTYEEALKAMRENQYDVYLVDYRLGSRDGVELLREAIRRGCRGPIILLTGWGGLDVDVEAMKAGAADYLVKDQLDASLLERAIRYAVERTRTREHLRSMAAKLVLTEERERRKIAAELHDHIGQVLALSKVKLRGLQTSVPSKELGEAVGGVLELIEQAIQDTRTLTFELSPPVLYEVGFEPAVEWLAEQFEKKHAIHIEVEDDGKTKPMGSEVRVLLFRAVRELLINVVKHAEVDRARVTMCMETDAIRITVEDGGKGFDPSMFETRKGETEGFGLFKNQERLEHLGGSLEIISAPGKGTRVVLLAPCKEKEGVPEEKMV